VSVVAEQLGFETLEDDGPDRFKASSPTGQDDRDAIIEMCAEAADHCCGAGSSYIAAYIRSLKSSHVTGEDR
jgi:hypothetical protein